MEWDEKDISLQVTAPAPEEQSETLGEEIANSASHGIGFIAILIATPFLIKDAVRTGRAAVITGASIFCAALLLLYLTSTLYHAFPKGKAKHAFRITEHALIYVLIAGTYTPFTLGVLHGAWGWSLFGINWALALAGVLLKIVGGPSDYPVLSMSLYLGMGWLVLVAIYPFWTLMPHVGLAWIAAGGLAYTLGVPFYLMDRKFSHFIWHLFVMAGSALHCFAVLWYAD